jgi:malate dehydrogenase (oxaloacetate-decarboxylating)(NADP+)
LLNALELANKKIEEVKIVVNGAGAAAVSCTKLYKAFGAKQENIVMCDSKGVIRKDNPNLSKQKAEFATDRDLHSLEEAIEGADVFIGLSVADVMTAKMLKTMANTPIVFALANPVPEIDYNLAIKTREDIIMATGRSDHPNQVNNVLGFPYIFRGALDVRSTKINEEMKMAAVRALAELAKESVPEEVNITYQEKKLSFGRDYIIPKPFDPRLIERVPPAVAKAAMDSGVAKLDIEDWEKYKNELFLRSGNENKLVRNIHNRAKSNPKRIVFADGEQLDVVKAAQIVFEEGIAHPILLGRKSRIEETMKELEFEGDIEIIDPKVDETHDIRQTYAKAYWEGRKRTGITEYLANNRMKERTYFGAMMVRSGDADGMVAGYSRAYTNVIIPLLEIIGKEEGVKRVCSANILITDMGPLFLADTTMNIDPNSEDLSEIALRTAKVVKTFGFDPVMAMLSYSNFGSSLHPQADKVKKAVRYLHKHHQDLVVDGELQLDFALNKEMHQKIFPFSKLAGKKVNTLIFPNLESANITYKLLKEVNHSDSIGPFLLGMNHPVHVLQLGASVNEIVNMVAVTVIDAQERKK